jgi:hypothetical protein
MLEHSYINSKENQMKRNRKTGKAGRLVFLYQSIQGEAGCYTSSGLKKWTGKQNESRHC